MNRDRERLEHIRDAVMRIKSYTASLTESDFLTDNMLQDAVLYQFSIIGEAIAHVSDDLLCKYDYPWYAVRSFRNYITHQYFGINLAKVWATVAINLPELETVLNRIIDSETFR
ncbi:MAG: DUF86 domain-containing protein [Tannerella sp.]|nr:DUF86 domain-containing protein [Tannerella sp.]